MRRNEAFHLTDAKLREMADQYLDRPGMPESDRAVIRAFVDEIQSLNHISPMRRQHLVMILTSLHRFAPKPLTALSNADVFVTIDRIRTGTSARGTPLSAATRHDYVKTLKRFLLWLLENEMAAPGLTLQKIKRITPPPAPRMTKTAAMLLTPSEITAMLTACRTSRDRALIATLYEGGFRIGEIGSLTWGQVEVNDWNLIVNVDAKTEKPRYIPLVMAKPYLAQWANDYPGVQGPDAYVFVNQYGNPIRYTSIKDHLKLIAARAGITKKVTPHLFRHSRITHLLREGFPESMVKMMLWGNITTDMFATYAHLSNSDILNEIKIRHGLADREAERDRGADAIQCPRCKEIAGPTQTHCPKCLYPLTPEAKASYAMAQASLYQPQVLREMAAALERGELVVTRPELR